MPTFTPPPVPEGMDIMEHVWATRHAIQSWSPRKLIFDEVTLHDDFRFELLTHPRLQRPIALSSRPINSMWGMKIQFTLNWTFCRRYTITYREA